MTKPLDRNELAKFAAFWNETAVLRWLGFTLSFPSDVDGTRVRVELKDVKPGQRGGKGTDAINGGVLAAMYDFAIGCCSVISPPLRRSATTQLNMNFERAVRGDYVRCEAIVNRATKNLLFVSAHITDGADNVCSHATGIVSMLEEVKYDDWMAALGPSVEGGSAR